MAVETVEKHDVHDEHATQEDWGGGAQPFKASYGKLMMWYFLLSDAFTFAGFLISYGALRFSTPTWPVPDFVFKSLPFLKGEYPLIFVTIMTFVLIVSSVTMVRAVQEGHRENRKGVRYWMVLTIIGGACFLGCQAYEWTALIAHEHMSLTENPFGTHIYDGAYLDEAGNPTDDTFVMGDSYLIHKHEVDGEMVWDKRSFVIYDEAGQITLDEEGNQMVLQEELGPKAFGALFFFITGFHGFHVFSGLVILAIIAMNVASGIYVERRNGYEMVEKVGLYWHFVDLVWVFVFLVFYLL